MASVAKIVRKGTTCSAHGVHNVTGVKQGRLLHRHVGSTNHGWLVWIDPRHDGLHHRLHAWLHHRLHSLHSRLHNGHAARLTWEDVSIRLSRKLNHLNRLQHLSPPIWCRNCHVENLLLLAYAWLLRRLKPLCIRSAHTLFRCKSGNIPSVICATATEAIIQLGANTLVVGKVRRWHTNHAGLLQTSINSWRCRRIPSSNFGFPERGRVLDWSLIVGHVVAVVIISMIGLDGPSHFRSTVKGRTRSARVTSSIEVDRGFCLLSHPRLK